MVAHSKKQDFAEMAQEIALDLRELARAMRRPIEEEAAHAGITLPQQNVMQVLIRSDGLSLKELSKQVGLAHATVSGIVDRLEKRGMVVRRPNTDDRRFTKIMISDAVRRNMPGRLRTLTIDPLQKALRRATPAERRLIRAGLRALSRVLETSKPSPEARES
jgi:MarR family transcriptional regulator, organic hydroperoxide resistance regulator